MIFMITIINKILLYKPRIFKNNRFTSGVRIPVPGQQSGDYFNVTNNNEVTVNATTNAAPSEIAGLTEERIAAANRAAAAALRQRKR